MIELNLDILNSNAPWVTAMEQCGQSPVHHAEGNVLIHTRMVCQELLQLPDYQKLSPELKRILLGGAVLHDVGKPDSTKIDENGEYITKGHANIGSLIARKLLYTNNWTFEDREHVCGLVRWHMRPYWTVSNEYPERSVAEMSFSSNCTLLSLLARADNLGRIPRNSKNQLHLDIFDEYVYDLKCNETPYQFLSDHTRYKCFHDMNADGTYIKVNDNIYHDVKCTVIMMSGLPGSGKDSWIKANHPDMPVISLDDIRRKINIKPTDNQGQVIAYAQEAAKSFLRKGIDFIWNATNLSIEMRNKVKRLFSNYNAKIHMVYIESDYNKMLYQNKNREHSVPETVIQNMMDCWELPTLRECHKLTYVASNSVSDFPRNIRSENHDSLT